MQAIWTSLTLVLLLLYTSVRSGFQWVDVLFMAVPLRNLAWLAYWQVYRLCIYAAARV